MVPFSSWTVSLLFLGACWLTTSPWVSVTELFLVLNLKSLNPSLSLTQARPAHACRPLSGEAGGPSLSHTGGCLLWGRVLSEDASAWSATPGSPVYTPPLSFWGPSGTGAQGGTDHLSDLQAESSTQVILLLGFPKLT